MRRRPRKQKTVVSSLTSLACAICSEPITPSLLCGQLLCGHNSFCLSCIHTCATTSTNKCPVCNERFSIILLSRLSNGLIVPVGGRLTVADRDPPRLETPRQAEYAMCVKCGSGEKEEQMLLCGGCKKGFHTECVGLRLVPNVEMWYCGECVRGVSEDVRTNQLQEMRLAGWSGDAQSSGKPPESHIEAVRLVPPSPSFPPGFFSVSDPIFDSLALSLTSEDL